MGHVESHTEIDHRIRQEATPLADVREPIIADHQLTIRVLPSKGPLNLVAPSIAGSVKPPKLPSNGDGLLGIATVRRDHWFPLLGFDRVPIAFGVKSGVSGQSRSRKIDPKTTRKSNKMRQGFWENDGIVLVDRFDRDRPKHKAVVVYDGHLFFAFLVFMAGVTNAVAPLFTTVLEPSPWSTEVSSCLVSWRGRTDAAKRA